MKRVISLSVVDQALLSTLSLAINLALVKFANPASVGSFAVASAMTFLAMGVQNAVVITPAAVRIYGIGAEKQKAILSTLTSVDLLLNFALTLACLIGSLAMGFTLLQSASAALFLSSSLIRELARGVLIGNGNVQRCIVLDALCVLLCAAGAPLLWGRLAPEVACLLVLAASNMVSSWAFSPVLHRQPNRLRHHLASYPRYWAESRWMLVGASATELHERSYVFMLQLLRGMTTVGTVHAGRILIGPISLLTTAWGRAMRPRMAALMENGQHGAARSILLSGLAITTMLTLAYAAVLFLLWGYIDRQLFAGRYENMWQIVVAWCGYGLLSIPANCLSFYFQAERRFKPLALNALVSGAGSLACMLLLILPVPDLTAIFCLYAGIIVVLIAQFGWWFRPPVPLGVKP